MSPLGQEPTGRALLLDLGCRAGAEPPRLQPRPDDSPHSWASPSAGALHSGIPKLLVQSSDWI